LQRALELIAGNPIVVIAHPQRVMPVVPHRAAATRDR
jgi:hypothetical protein